MKLYFIRHGKAGHSATSDAARPLTDVGIQQAQHNGRLLAAMSIQASKLYCSPRVRAQETAAIIGEALDTLPEITEACDFDFSLDKALRLVKDMAADSQVLFVGHNPSMSMVVSEITGANVQLSTCAMACVSLTGDEHGYLAVLDWLVTPKVVRAMLEQ